MLHTDLVDEPTISIDLFITAVGLVAVIFGLTLEQIDIVLLYDVGNVSNEDIVGLYVKMNDP